MTDINEDWTLNEVGKMEVLIYECIRSSTKETKKAEEECHQHLKDINYIFCEGCKYYKSRWIDEKELRGDKD